MPDAARVKHTVELVAAKMTTILMNPRDGSDYFVGQIHANFGAGGECPNINVVESVRVVKIRDSQSQRGQR